MPAQSIPQENKMGTMPVKKLIFNMALPLIISMLIQALYNIVDSIFVSRISEDAFTAVSLVFPIQNLMIAFATGTGVGMNALLSRRLGEKNREGAEAVANVGLLLAICSGVAFALFGLFGTGLFFSMQKGISPVIAEYGSQYLSIVCKRHSQKTAIEWITEYTLSDITYYLRSTNRSIKEISAILGFSNTSFFGKYVREHLHMSPLKYRESLRKK